MGDQPFSWHRVAREGLGEVRAFLDRCEQLLDGDDHLATNAWYDRAVEVLGELDDAFGSLAHVTIIAFENCSSPATRENR